LLQRETNGLRTYQFENLAGYKVVHAVFTRLGGVSREPFATLNVGRLVGDDEAAVAANHRRIYAALDLAAGQVVTARQVHGNHVAGLLLRFADCQPILLYDPEHHALGLAHAGWRGVGQGIARRAVEAMQEAFGTRPGALLAGLGPAIGPSCYVVGHEVAATMGYALPDWQAALRLEGEDAWRLDLSAANAQLLAAAGVTQIEQAGICTSCRKDEFFSHRGEGGRTGRFAALAYLEPWSEHAPAGRAPAAAKRGDKDELAGFDSLQPPGLPAFGPIGEGDL
jgi:copper oxidase (laccase) domain-containing protein